jgi:hypothetical protein
MDPKTVVLSLILALTPGVLVGQTLADERIAASARDTRVARGTLEGAAGVTLGGGHVQSVSLGFAASPWLTLLVQGERFHVPTRHEEFPNGSSITRGFTTLVLGGEVRVGGPVSRRVSAYTALGVGIGAWGSNVDRFSQSRDSGPVQTAYVGGGVRVRMRRNLSVVADARCALTAAGESLLGSVPIRGGLAVDF